MSKQQTIIQFRKRLNRNSSPYGEYIISNPQFQGVVEDAVGLFSLVKYVNGSATIQITADDPVIPLPLDFLDGFNDDLLLALSSGTNVNLPKYTYSAFNFGYIPNSRPYPFPVSSYQGYNNSSYYTYGKQPLSNPILPTSPVQKRPGLITTTIGGITYPAIVANPVPTADQEIPIYYVAKQSITDDTLILTFSQLPSNGDTFDLDGATFEFINTTPSTDFEIEIGATLSLNSDNIAEILANLNFITEANGQSVSISNSTGTVFDYDISGLSNVTDTYTSGVDTIHNSDKWAIYDLMKAKALEGLISQKVIEDKRINEITKYYKELIDDTLLKLNT